MAYEDEADEHERLLLLKFELQRRLDATPATEGRIRIFLREALDDIERQLERVRRRHRE